MAMEHCVLKLHKATLLRVSKLRSTSTPKARAAEYHARIKTTNRKPLETWWVGKIRAKPRANTVAFDLPPSAIYLRPDDYFHGNLCRSSITVTRINKREG